MKIIEIDEDLNVGIADVSGFRRKVRLDLLESVEIGDYVIVHAGFAIQKLHERDAMETLKLLGEMFTEEY